MSKDVDQFRPTPRGDGVGTGGIRWISSLLRGLRQTCPRCGDGRLFGAYITMKRSCNGCGLEYAPYRADDAPAYFTIFAVGHIIVPSMLILEQTLHPATWVHMALWMPLTLGLALVLLPRIKGAVIGVQWALNMKSEAV
ncbi:MAG: DUF983 domain-containing protein [Alphaproteobacteria bacterium]|nr:DUF983 domain-containing protein [Alphaproteobacteria bacterium]